LHGERNDDDKESEHASRAPTDATRSGKGDLKGGRGTSRGETIQRQTLVQVALRETAGANPEAA